MQYLLNQLDAPITIGLIVAGVLALVIVVLLTRRLRRRKAPPDEAVSSLGGPIDYTSLPLDEEPKNLRERFASLSLAGKILAILVPVLAILGMVVLLLTLLPPTNTPAQAIPLPEPVSLEIVKADLIRVDPAPTISVEARSTGLGDGTKVTVALLADGQPIDYLQPDQLSGEVRGGRVQIQARAMEGAAAPPEGPRYTVKLSTDDGQASEMDLTVPSLYADAFFGRNAQVEPTATVPAPTAAPTEIPATAEASPEPSPTTVATALPTGPAVAVGNGGNVRKWPVIAANNRVGGVDAGNQVQLIERTPNGSWYRVRFTNTDDGAEALGWVSASLLQVDQATLAQVPVATVVSVFANGAVFEKPDGGTTELDRVNKGEVALLTHKTANGDWYEITNIRDISGWVSADLLGIPADVAAKVPVAP